MAPLSERQNISNDIRRPVQVRPEVSPAVNNVTPNQAYRQPVPTPQIARPALESKPVRPQSRRLPLKRKHLIVGGALIIVLIAAFSSYLFVFSHKSEAVASKKEPILTANLSQPNFIPLVPQGKSGLAKENSSTSFFNKAHDVYMFDDTYLGIPIQVSEEPLASNNNTSPNGNMNSLIKEYSANTPFTFAGGTAYESNSTVTNKQTVLFNEKGIIVIIQSSLNVQSDGWVSYIDNLYQP